MFNTAKKNVLIIAAHPDDEILGGGGTIAKFKEQGCSLFLCVLSPGESSRSHPDETTRLRSLNQVKEFLKIDFLKVFNFKDSQFDSHPILEIIQAIESVCTEFKPNIILTHSDCDINIDHKVTHLATMTAARALPKSSVEMILSYEILSSTEYGLKTNPFVPNYFVELTNTHVNTKLNALKYYQDEMRDSPHPRSFESVKAQLTLRGSSIGAVAAEAFQLERMILK